MSTPPEPPERAAAPNSGWYDPPEARVRALPLILLGNAISHLRWLGWRWNGGTYGDEH